VSGESAVPAAASPAVAEPDALSTETLLAVEDLRVDFHAAGRHVRAVDGLSYAVRRGQTVAMIGESGCGKTVSSRALMGLLPRTARVTGSARFEGRELVGLAEKRMREVRGAGRPIRADHIADLDSPVGPERDGAGGAELGIVGVGHDDQRALKVFQFG